MRRDDDSRYSLNQYSPERFDFNILIRFESWARAAETLYQEGQIALRENELQRAYLMLYRYSKLLVDHLPTHPDYAANRRLTKRLFDRQARVFDQLAAIKPSIEREYDDWMKMVETATAAQQRRQRSLAVDRPGDPADYKRASSVRNPPRVLNPAEHQELAVYLAEKELRRRRRSGMRDQHSPNDQRPWSPVHSERGPEGLSHNVLRRTPSFGGLDDDEFKRQIEATRRKLDGPREGVLEPDIRQSYHFPKIVKSRPLTYEPKGPLSASPRRPLSQPAPFVPPKEPFRENSVSVKLSYAPTFPRDEPLSDHGPSTTYSQSGSLAPFLLTKANRTAEVLPMRPPKEIAVTSQYRTEKVSFKPTAFLENGDPLRSIFLPNTLRQNFLDVAQRHTDQGLEMCGILCGSAVNNALFISCLLIPEQKCTSDTCETENEPAVLEYCVSEDLLIIGWIHTHPTQTCFMSSRDLHTQAGYQVMMPESIAIVCAPRFEPSFGIFRLTQPPGLLHVLSCAQTDNFHRHDCDDLYTGAQRPNGHVYETSKLDFVVHDLRFRKR